MEDQTPLQVLGLEPSATPSDIKTAYKTLARTFHPDRNNSPDATSLFQKLNNAYQSLINIAYRPNGDTDTHGSQSYELCYVSLSTKQNTYCVTVSIVEPMFLVILDECRKHHPDVTPVDRRHHGLQLQFQYSSPGDAEPLGYVSLTFYASTSILHVQGSSYLLWVEEHMPHVLSMSEDAYKVNPGSWNDLAVSQNIGCGRRPTRHPTSSFMPPPPDYDNRTALADPANAVLAPVAALPANASAVPVTDMARLSISATEAHSPALPPTEIQTTDTAIYQPSSPAAFPPSSPAVSFPRPVTPRGEGGTATPGVDQNKSPVKSTAKPSKKRGNKSKSGKAPTGKKSGSSSSKSWKKCSGQCKVSRLSHASGDASGDMIRCALCMRWLHIACIDEGESSYSGIWTCAECRLLPSTVTALSSQLHDVLTCMQSMQESVRYTRDELRQMQSENVIMRESEKAVLAENEKLKHHNGRLTTKLADADKRKAELEKIIDTMSFSTVQTGSDRITASDTAGEMWATPPANIQSFQSTGSTTRRR